MSHTPTPWKVHAPRDGWVSIHGPNGEEIVDLNHSDGADEPTLYPERENAEFIVRACNAHDDLLAAIRKVVNNWGDLHHKDLMQLRAAIAKAEGRS